MDLGLVLARGLAIFEAYLWRPQCFCSCPACPGPAAEPSRTLAILERQLERCGPEHLVPSPAPQLPLLSGALAFAWGLLFGAFLGVAAARALQLLPWHGAARPSAIVGVPSAELAVSTPSTLAHGRAPRPHA